MTSSPERCRCQSSPPPAICVMPLDCSAYLRGQVLLVHLVSCMSPRGKHHGVQAACRTGRMLAGVLLTGKEEKQLAIIYVIRDELTSRLST